MPILKYTADGTNWNPLLAGPTGPAGPPGWMGNNRNFVVNSDFSVNQRAFTALTNASGSQGYCVDHWRMVNNNTVGSVTFSANAAALGELPESAPTSFRVATGGMTENSSRSALFQQFEDVRPFAGGYATVSFWAKANVAAWVGVEIRQSMANGGAGTTTQSKKVLIGTTWGRYYATIYVPSLSGRTIADSTDHVQLLLWTSSGADYQARSDYTPIQNATVDFWGIQAEAGDRMTPYEYKPYAEHLRDCMRYFQRWTQPPLRGVQGSATTAGRIGMILPVPMRIKPTPSLVGSISVHDGIGTGVWTSISGDYSSPNFIEYDIAHGSYSVVNRPCVVYMGQAASYYLDLSAEW